MISINSFNNEVFNCLKEYVEENNTYGAIVRLKPIQNTYPMVIFQCNSNVEGSSTKDLYGIEKTRSLSFEITIIATDKTKEQVSSIEICNQLEDLVTQVMQGIYRMKGGTDAKIVNINNANASQYVLHFNCEWYMQKNIIY